MACMCLYSFDIKQHRRSRSHGPNGLLGGNWVAWEHLIEHLFGVLLLWRSFLRHACGIHIHNTSLGYFVLCLHYSSIFSPFLASFVEAPVSPH